MQKLYVHGHGGQCVACSACLAPSLRRYQFILFGKQRHMCVNNLTRVGEALC